MTPKCRCGVPAEPGRLRSFLALYCAPCREIVSALVLTRVLGPDLRRREGRARRKALRGLLDAGREFEEETR